MLRGRRYLDKVTLFASTQSQNDYGDVVDVFVNKGDFYCDVTQITGFRLMQYQQLGINYPIRIEMRELDFTPVKALWGGNEIIIRSVVPDLRTRLWLIDGYMQESMILPTTTAAPTTISPTTLSPITT